MMDDTYFKTRLSYEPQRDAVWAEITRYLQRFVPRDSAVLELGAGYCSFINQIEAREKHALDRSEVINRYAKPPVIRHIQDCEDLRSFTHGYFDVIFSSFLFEHLTREKLNRVLVQVRRILKPNGTLITLLPNFKYISRHYFDDYTHVQIFSHISFSDYLVSRGFTVGEVQGRFLPYSFKSWLPQSPLLTRLYLSLPFRPFAGNMLVVARNMDAPSKPVPKSSPPRRDQKARPDTRRQDPAAAGRHQARDDRFSRTPDRDGRRFDSGEKPIDAEQVAGAKEPVRKESQAGSGPAPRETPDPIEAQTGIRHGRRSRRSAAEHYGVKPIVPDDVRPGIVPDADPGGSTSEAPEIAFSGREGSGGDTGPISPLDLRNRRRKK